MNITLVTVAYNGYGKFADQWLKAISCSTILPEQVIIALGPNHGLENHEELHARHPKLKIHFHFCESTKPLMGPMRNQVMNHVETEWVQYLSIDDTLMPEAIQEYARLEDQADYICISWFSIATWKENAKPAFHQGKTPMRLAKEFEGRGFINAQSPFRYWLWKKESYMNHDYPNAPFLAGCVKSGARFVHTDVPCTIYLQRLDSHAQRLGRRGKAYRDEKERQKAIHWKQYCKKIILEHFA